MKLLRLRLLPQRVLQTKIPGLGLSFFAGTLVGGAVFHFRRRLWSDEGGTAHAANGSVYPDDAGVSQARLKAFASVRVALIRSEEVAHDPLKATTAAANASAAEWQDAQDATFLYAQVAQRHYIDAIELAKEAIRCSEAAMKLADDAAHHARILSDAIDDTLREGTAAMQHGAAARLKGDVASSEFWRQVYAALLLPSGSWEKTVLAMHQTYTAVRQYDEALRKIRSARLNARSAMNQYRAAVNKLSAASDQFAKAVDHARGAVPPLESAAQEVGDADDLCQAVHTFADASQAHADHDIA
jgi:hypothetical protein